MAAGRKIRIIEVNIKQKIKLIISGYKAKNANTIYSGGILI